MFPAVSTGFDVSRILNSPQVNNLKLRASYGVTGALPPQSYLSLLTFTAQTGRNFYAGNDVWLQPYGPNRNANPDLKWERKAETDFGLDFALGTRRSAGQLFLIRTISPCQVAATVPATTFP